LIIKGSRCDSITIATIFKNYHNPGIYKYILELLPWSFHEIELYLFCRRLTWHFFFCSS